MTKKDEEIVFQPKKEAIYKVIVIGDPQVGKTSLLSKYSTKKFEEKYLPTVGVNIVKEEIEFENNKINLMLWDVAGQRFKHIA